MDLRINFPLDQAGVYPKTQKGSGHEVGLVHAYSEKNEKNFFLVNFRHKKSNRWVAFGAINKTKYIKLNLFTKGFTAFFCKEKFTASGTIF